MAERSRFWDGTTLGDATEAPYSAQEFAQVMLGMLAQNNTSPWQRSFVSFGQGYGVGSLLVTGTATPVSIAAGAAVVAGIWYENDASTTLAVSTPAANPRRDRVVLRADWAAQTVRLALLAGAEAATPTAPALTQIFGTTWEVSLATVYVTTGGVITVTDERPRFLGLSRSVLFRDLYQRENEEFFDHFNSGTDGATTLSGSNHPWYPILTGTGAATISTTSPSSFNLTTGATNGSTAIAARGRGTGSNFFPTRLSQAPLLLEASIGQMAAADAQATGVMRLTNTGNTQMIEYGVIGSVSTTNLVLRGTNAGTTSFNTGQAFGVGYHTMGIYVPASGGPVLAVYDGTVIGQIAANLPAAATNLRAEFYVANGATASARAINVDWVRLVRGTQ